MLSHGCKIVCMHCIHIHFLFLQGQQKPLILTSSFDRSVRLWTIEGQFVGIFGQKDLWDPRLTVQSWSKEIVVEMNSKGVYRNR